MDHAQHAHGLAATIRTKTGNMARSSLAVSADLCVTGTADSSTQPRPAATAWGFNFAAALGVTGGLRFTL